MRKHIFSSSKGGKSGGVKTAINFVNEYKWKLTKKDTSSSRFGMIKKELS